MPVPSERQRRMIHNALGLLYSKKAYRNHYVVGAGTPTETEWDQLVAHGYAERGRPIQPDQPSKQVWFYVTEKGAALFGQELPRD